MLDQSSRPLAKRARSDDSRPASPRASSSWTSCADLAEVSASSRARSRPSCRPAFRRARRVRRTGSRRGFQEHADSARSARANTHTPGVSARGEAAAFPAFCQLRADQCLPRRRLCRLTTPQRMCRPAPQPAVDQGARKVAFNGSLARTEKPADLTHRFEPAPCKRRCILQHYCAPPLLRANPNRIGRPIAGRRHQPMRR